MKSEGSSGGGMFGETSYSDVSSSSTKNQFLLTSRGYGQNPQQGELPIETLLNPDAGGGYVRVGAMEVGPIGFVGGGLGSMQGSPSFCYGCNSWGFSYPVTAF